VSGGVEVWVDVSESEPVVFAEDEMGLFSFLPVNSLETVAGEDGGCDCGGAERGGSPFCDRETKTPNTASTTTATATFFGVNPNFFAVSPDFLTI